MSALPAETRPRARRPVQETVAIVNGHEIVREREGASTWWHVYRLDADGYVISGTAQSYLSYKRDAVAFAKRGGR